MLSGHGSLDTKIHGEAVRALTEEKIYRRQYACKSFQSLPYSQIRHEGEGVSRYRDGQEYGH